MVFVRNQIFSLIILMQRSNQLKTVVLSSERNSKFLIHDKKYIKNHVVNNRIEQLNSASTILFNVVENYKQFGQHNIVLLFYPVTVQTHNFWLSKLAEPTKPSKIYTNFFTEVFSKNKKMRTLLTDTSAKVLNIVFMIQILLKMVITLLNLKVVFYRTS